MSKLHPNPRTARYRIVAVELYCARCNEIVPVVSIGSQYWTIDEIGLLKGDERNRRVICEAGHPVLLPTIRQPKGE